MVHKIIETTRHDYDPVNKYIDEKARLRRTKSIWKNTRSASLGLIAFGVFLILAAYAYHIFKKIRDTNDNVFKMILIGSISLLMMQAFIHVGVNLRVFPTTGMTLPFLSYGGSSIIGSSILAGIILNLTKKNIS